jgi:ADP-heptose:LPS heptosyltransferase
MKKILVINLTRMGDLVQSIPLLSGLKKKYPQSYLTLLVNNAFSYVVGSIPHIDRYMELDFARLYVDLLSPQSNFSRCYAYLVDFFGGIKKEQYDLVVNLTPTRLAAVATFLARGKEAMGITLDPEGYRLIRNPWMNYLLAAGLYGDLNLFNLVDIFTKGGGINPGEGEYSLKVADQDQGWADDLLKAERVTSSEHLIGFQLGASAAKRVWPAESFSKLANLLSQRFPLRIFLFGSEGEKELAASFRKSFRGNCLDLMGKTNFGQLAALLQKMAVLVTNDTGPMHIAAAVHTQIVAIFLGSATCFNTGPYQKGAFVVHPHISCFPCNTQAKCLDFRCHEKVEPEFIETLVSTILDKKGFCFPDSERWKSVDLYQAGLDEDGMMEYLPVFKRPLTERDFFNHMTREIWKNFLDKRTDHGDILSQDDTQQMIERLKKRLNYYQVKRGTNGDFTIKEEAEWIDLLRSLGTEGATCSKNLMKEARESPLPVKNLKDLNKKLKRINEEIAKVGLICKALSSIVQLHQFAWENMQGEDLRDLSRQALEIYQNFSLQCQMLKDIIALGRFNSPAGSC